MQIRTMLLSNRWRAALSLSFTFWLVPAALPQQTAQTSPDIHVSVDRVNVGVVVTDARGQFVGGLNRKDFRIFDDGTDPYWARSRVLEYLSSLGNSLPKNVTPALGPDATGVGHIFWYTVEGPGHDLRELRALQDWFIRYQLNSVPGVAEVARWKALVELTGIRIEG